MSSLDLNCVSSNPWHMLMYSNIASNQLISTIPVQCVSVKVLKQSRDVSAILFNCQLRHGHRFLSLDIQNWGP